MRWTTWVLACLLGSASPLPPLPGEWIEPLGDLGVVAIPVGATEARPIVVAVHGSWDRPEWSCGEWRAVLGPRPFIVCPRGAPRDAAGTGFYWRSAAHLRAAIDGATARATETYGPYMDEKSPRVYAGFSQGAILGARVVRESKQYPYVIFQEGFGDELASRAVDARIAAAGVKRVLLGCSQAGCAGTRAPIRAAMASAGIDVRVNDAGRIGHTMGPRVYASLRRDVPWLLAGEAAWAGVVADVQGP